MRKIFSLCTIILILANMSFKVIAKTDVEDITYEEFEQLAKGYDKLDLISGDIEVQSKNLGEILDKILNLFLNEFRMSLKSFLLILIICILLTVQKNFSSKKTFSDVAEYGIYCLCGMIIVSGFKSINDICVSGIENLSDFMDIAVPTYVTVISACGYPTTAVTVQSIFMVISIVLTHVIKGFICPLLFCCGLVAIVSGVSGTIDLSGVIKLISSTIKYTLGIIMTIFAGILAFTGFSSSATDSLALQTAKFAVANFVPIVGGCLSSALSALKQSSLVLKNGMGYISFFVMLSLTLMPIIKIMTYVFSMRLSASIAHLFSESKLGATLDSLCDVIVTLGALVVLVSVIFILLIGVISSVG